jgi:RNA polymerase sigma-70 factor (ECF subfamily)
MTVIFMCSSNPSSDRAILQLKKTRRSDRHTRYMQGASLEEIERVYRERLPEFRRVAAAMLGDREAARDAVQEGFAIAVRKRKSFRREGPLEAWLWRVVINAVREQARRRVEVLDPEAITSRNGSHADEPDARVRVALALLPERQRLTLFLHYYADLDYRTIAEMLGVTIGSVGVTLSTAQTRLRELLEEAPR